MSAQLDPDFSLALRGQLVEHVRTAETGARSRLRWPRTVGLRIALATGVLAAGGGAAAATGVLSLWPPGSPVITALARPITVTGTGTETISLGTQPAGANGVRLQFTCLSAGNFTFVDGSGEDCDQPDTSPATTTLPLAAGQDSTVITAGAGERWQATVGYVSATVSPWQTNASGQTYGVENQNGTPDLIPAIATNGMQGYVYAKQLQGPQPTGPAQAVIWDSRGDRIITVYESDGKTPIGKFNAGN